jgi:acyl-CoA synthetase (NDP forming)
MFGHLGSSPRSLPFVSGSGCVARHNRPATRKGPGWGTSYFTSLGNIAGYFDLSGAIPDIQT